MFGSIPDARSWVGLFVLGVIQLGLSYVLYSKAIKHVTAIEAILIPGIEPILNPIWVFLILGERPGKWALIGGFIVLISVTLRSLIAIRRRDLPS
jgi:drug/metabolite transporter (DMT)-like permease